MELTVDNSNKTNLTNQVAFTTTEDSTKLFSMLSSFLYSNRELAVLHELSSNAVDAHRMVGKIDVPIEVCLPTNLSPQLKVKDSGPGLSHPDVIKFLTTYGKSNKVGDKNLIGGYGIGSKSPAAVTDTWQIVSKHAGTGIQYIVAIDGHGVPTLSKLREFDTTETGLEVVVPVHTNHVNNWHVAAREAFEHYPIKPKVVGSTLPVSSKKSAKEKIGSYKLYENNYYNNKTAVIGIRGYKIDFAQISSLIDQNYLPLFRHMEMTINLDLNAVDVDLSRENLRYSAKTLDSLVSKFNEVGGDIKSDILDDLSKTTGMISYLSKVREWYDIVGDFIFEYTKTPPYIGVKVSCYNDLSKIKFTIANPAFYKIGFRGSISQLSASFTCGRTHNVCLLVNRSAKTYEFAINLHVLKNVVFVLDDAKGIANRVRHQMKSNEDEKIYVIASSFDEFADEIKDMAIKGSSLPEAPKALRGKAKVLKTDLYIKDGRRFLKVAENNITSRIADGELVLWTYIENGITDGDIYHKELEFIRTFSGKRPTVVGIKLGKPALTICKTVAEHYNDLKKGMQPQLQAYVDNVFLRMIKSDYWFTNVVGLKLLNLKPFEIMQKISLLKEEAEQLSTNTKLKNSVDLTNITVSDNLLKLSEELNVVKEKFPMLKFVLDRYCSYTNTSLASAVVDYVNLIEKE